MKRDLKYELSDVSVTKRLMGVSTLLVVISIGMLAFRDGVPTNSSIIALLGFGCVGIFFLTLLALKNLKRLRNELIIRSSFIGQREVSEELKGLAINLREQSRLDIELQKEVAQHPDPDYGLITRHQIATASFKGYQEIFFNLCKALDEAGYDVYKTTEGKYSIKLYWPKEEKDPAAQQDEHIIDEYVVRAFTEEQLKAERDGHREQGGYE